MTRQDRNDPPRRAGANPAQLKGDIDSGRTGDKIGGFDPAAAPLGTDAEAGGAATDPVLASATRAQERAGRPSSGKTNAATPELQPDARMRRGGVAVPLLLGVCAAAALAAILLLVA